MASPTQQPDLEALEERRDFLFLACCKSGTVADWAEYERVSADLRAKLLARLDAYLDRPWPASETVTIDHEALDRWVESPAARDYLPTSEE